MNNFIRMNNLLNNYNMMLKSILLNVFVIIILTFVNVYCNRPPHIDDPYLEKVNTIYYHHRWFALKVMDVLLDFPLNKHYQNFETCNILIKDPISKLERWQLNLLYHYKLKRDIPEDISTELITLEGDVLTQVEMYLNFFEIYSGIDVRKFSNKTSDLCVFLIDKKYKSSRGFNFDIRIIDKENKTILNYFVFRNNNFQEQRPWIAMHEMMHGLLKMRHDKNGNPVKNISKIGIDGLKTELTTSDSMMLYDGRSSFDSPGSILNDGTLYMGQYDWSILQLKAYPRNYIDPRFQGKSIINIDGLGVRRGSPGPEEWFDEIIITGTKDRSNIDINSYVFRKALTANWNYGFEFPFMWSDERNKQLWYDLWDVERVFVKWVPGDTLFKYRSDYLRGPSFHPMKFDSKLKLTIQNVDYANIQVYGSNKTIYLDRVQKAHIILGTSLDIVIRGYEPTQHWLVEASPLGLGGSATANNTYLRLCENHKLNEIMLYWIEDDNNPNTTSIKSKVIFKDLNYCSLLKWCFSDEDCPKSVKHQHISKAFFTSLLLIQQPMLLLLMAIGASFICGCCCCCWISFWIVSYCINLSLHKIKITTNNPAPIDHSNNPLFQL